MDDKNSNQTARMRKLVLVFIRRTYLKVHFLTLWLMLMYTGADSEGVRGGGGGSFEPPLINFGQLFNKSILLPVNVCKFAG